MWRPEGWKNPFATIRGTPFLGSIVSLPELDKYQALYEAGADAMLEALRKNQWCPFDMSVMKANFKGKVVIIPDEEVKHEPNA